MAIKSIVDVQVNDEAFKGFHALFEKYQAALAKTPGDWAKVDKAVSGTALTVESLIAGLAAHTESARLAAAEQKKAADEAKRRTLEEAKSTEFWRKSAANAKAMARSVGDITLSLVKWGSVAAAFTGVAGAGAFFGLDSLANGVGYGRRYSQGIGVRYGEAKAFSNAYGRLVDPDTFLGGVNSSLTDVSKRSSLYGAGLTEGQLAGKDTAQVASILIPALKALADRTPTSQLAQLIASRNLGNLGISVQDLERLKKTTPEDLTKFASNYASGVSAFDVADPIARKWQDLGVQLDAAKLKIEAVLIKGLEPLAKPLGDLTDHIATALKIFLTGLDPKTIKELGNGIESFASYLVSPKFRKDLKTFTDDVSYAAGKMVSALKWLGLIPDSTPAPTTTDGSPAFTKLGPLRIPRVGAFASANDPNRPFSWFDPGSWLSRNGGLGGFDWGRPNDTNPGNIRAGRGYAHYANSSDGLRAIAKQLLLYFSGQSAAAHYKKLDTISDIIGTFAPSNENDTASYIKDVAGRLHVGANDHLNLGDNAVLSRLVSAITKHENRKTNYTPQVVIKVLNNTGGNAVVQANQAAK